MEMKIVGITVAILVSITLLAGVLMPVLDDATATTDTFTNESFYGLSAIDDNTDVTIVWKVATPQKITVNGEDVDLSTLPSSRSYTLIGSSSTMVRYTYVGGVAYLETLGTQYVNNNSNATNYTQVTFTINGMTMTYLDDRSTPITYDYTLSGDAYYIVPSGGEYTEVMKDASKPVYVLGDSDIHLIGSTLSNPIIGVYGEGSIDDGITLSTVYKANTVTTDVTYSDVTATTTEVSGYNDLYLLEKFEFTITYNTDQSIDSTYTYFVVPSEVTAERSVHFTDNQNALFAVIPMLVIVAILIGVVALVIRSRLD